MKTVSLWKQKAVWFQSRLKHVVEQSGLGWECLQVDQGTRVETFAKVNVEKQDETDQGCWVRFACDFRHKMTQYTEYTHIRKDRVRIVEMQDCSAIETEKLFRKFLAACGPQTPNSFASTKCFPSNSTAPPRRSSDSSLPCRLCFGHVFPGTLLESFRILYESEIFLN